VKEGLVLRGIACVKADLNPQTIVFMLLLNLSMLASGAIIEPLVVAKNWLVSRFVIGNYFIRKS